MFPINYMASTSGLSGSLTLRELLAVPIAPSSQPVVGPIIYNRPGVSDNGVNSLLIKTKPLYGAFTSNSQAVGAPPLPPRPRVLPGSAKPPQPPHRRPVFYYGVVRGHHTGIFTNWAMVATAVRNFPDPGTSWFELPVEATAQKRSKH